jgi:pimeloyl-ACP methyl ester carboxylesterase
LVAIAWRRGEELKAQRSELIVDARRLEVLECPAADGGINQPPIVMLHEGLGSISMWRDFPEQLATATRRRVMAYSRYGHGRSDVVRDPRTVEFMHHEGEVVLPELLERMGVRHPVLLGHSDGGSIALLYAAARPNAVNALILEAPHVFVEDLTVKSIRSLRDAYDGSGLGQRLARYHDHPDEMFRAWTEIWLDPAFRAWNIEDRLEAIRCPLLLMQGEDDHYGTRAQIDAITSRVSTAEAVMLPDCGHSPHRDQPETVLAAIAGFMRRID